MKQRQPRFHQAELFEEESDGPRWAEIPVDIRKTVTELVARMLLQSRSQDEGSVEHE